MMSMPESAVTGPGSCHTKRTSVSGSHSSTSKGPMKSSAVKPGYVTIAICVMPCSLGSAECFPVVVGWDANPSNKVAAHGFRGAKTAPRRDRRDGVFGLLKLAAGGLGADAFHVGARRLADLLGKHPGEMPRAHVDSARPVANTVRAARFSVDGILNGTDRFAFGPCHPHGCGELRLPAGAPQVQ